MNGKHFLHHMPASTFTINITSERSFQKVKINSAQKKQKKKNDNEMSFSATKTIHIYKHTKVAKRTKATTTTQIYIKLTRANWILSKIDCLNFCLDFINAHIFFFLQFKIWSKKTIFFSHFYFLYFIWYKDRIRDRQMFTLMSGIHKTMRNEREKS